jgi:hypothetical protein
MGDRTGSEDAVRGGPTMNITPFLRYGEDNVIELVSPYDRYEVKHVSLDFYDPTLAYP